MKSTESLAIISMLFILFVVSMSDQFQQDDMRKKIEKMEQTINELNDNLKEKQN